MKLKMTKGEVLIRSAAIAYHPNPREISQIEEFNLGLKLIAEAVEQAHQYNHQRLLRQANKLHNSFEKQAGEWFMVGRKIGEVLEDLGGTSDKA